MNQPQYDSRPVTSNQTGPHDRLTDIVMRQKNAPFQKPVADHNARAFDALETQRQRLGMPLILDSCCGIGESSWHLAKQYPDHLVIGIDKSQSRITRQTGFDAPENLILCRADLVDIWRLARAANWQPVRHFLLYPNPWPKAEHVKRRWHAMPVFADLVALGGLLEVRSNWQLYIEEFSKALECYDITADSHIYPVNDPVTPFERKYSASGQMLWRLTTDLGGANTK